MPTAVSPTMMPRIIDSYGSGMLDDVVVGVLALVDVIGEVSVSEFEVAEFCTEMN